MMIVLTSYMDEDESESKSYRVRASVFVAAVGVVGAPKLVREHAGVGEMG